MNQAQDTGDALDRYALECHWRVLPQQIRKNNVPLSTEETGRRLFQLTYNLSQSYQNSKCRGVGII